MSYLSLLRCCSLAAAGWLFCAATSRAGDLAPGGQGNAAGAAGNFVQLPLRFEANAGQTDPEAQFIARGRGFTIYLTRGEAVLALREFDRSGAEPKGGKAVGHSRRTQAVSKNTIQNNLRMTFSGANPQPEISGAESQPGTVSYFLGSEPERWRTGIPSFERVQYREVYPGIDLVFYGNQSQLEYDFNLRPGAEPSRIVLKFSGADNLALTDTGDLIITVAGGHLRWQAPVAFQDIDGSRRSVTCAFTLLTPDRIGFTVGDYDRAQPLTIDPLLVYSTYLGGLLQDIGQSIAVDRLGTVFVTGQADSLNFPTNRAFRGTNSGGADVFVTRLNTNATAFHYSTYVGGNGADIGFGIAVDSGGNAYVAGTTESGNFPRINAVQTSLHGSSDAFVFKLGTNGNNLIYSTLFGGDNTETAYGVAVDSGTNNAYIVGDTTSSARQQFTDDNTFPSFQDFGGDTDVFVAKFNTSSSGSGSMTWWTWLGGADADIGLAIAVDNTNAVYVTGEVLSCDFDSGGCVPNFPLKSAFQPKYGGYFSDAFVTKFYPNGASTVWSSYLGGTNSDTGWAIALDSSNNVFVAGSTSSSNFPVVNAFQPANGDFGGYTPDAFLVKIRANGSGLAYGTYLGGGIDDEARAVKVDIAGNAWITGLTQSGFPTNNLPLQPGFGGGPSDAFVAMINPNLSGASSLIFSTYLGGRGREIGNGIAVDTNGNCYVVGQTSGTNASSGVVQTNYGGGSYDAFVAKIFAAPLLKLSRSGTNHVATWPTFPTGFNLVSRTNVNTGTWSNMPGAVVVSNGMNRFVVTNTGLRKFIRLSKP